MVTTASSRENIIEVKGLTKIFKDFWGRPKAKAVNGIDFNVKKGQVFGLLGPNGSGKSTTVKMLLGLLKASRGSIKVFGQEPSCVNVKKNIGYLPEETYLYKYLSAEETLDFFASLFGLNSEERRKRNNQLLEMVGLGQSRKRLVGEFSKGMARRIGLAQALINDPALVILDEPTSGLDPIGCRDVKDLIKLLASRGKTVLLCSHLLADVEDVCDDMVVMYGGKIRSEGSLKEVLSVKDQVRITAPDLPQDCMESILGLIRQHANDDSITVDHPRMDLESFFLDVVNKAKSASVDTSGAQSGGKIAEYLQHADDDEVAPAEEAEPAPEGTAKELSAKVLEAMREEEELHKVEEAPVAEKEPEVEVDNSKLESLAVEEKVEPAFEEKEESSEEKPASEMDKEEVDEKLKNLLGGR